MKVFFARGRSSRALAAVALALLVAAVVRAAAPSWWSARGVTGGAASDYATANQGQFKNIAGKAKAEMDAKLYGGAGGQIDTLVEGWAAPSGGARDYAMLNAGQFKAVVKLYYDRLMEAGFDTKASLAAQGATGWNYDYPWNASGNNYTAVNLGQLKWAFSFDLTGFDSDLDGIPGSGWNPSAWNPSATDLNHNGIADNLDDFDGDGVTNGQEVADSTNPLNAGSATAAPTPAPDTTGANQLVIYTPLN